jgi:hypothetical protein
MVEARFTILEKESNFGRRWLNWITLQLITEVASINWKVSSRNYFTCASDKNPLVFIIKTIIIC